MTASIIVVDATHWLPDGDLPYDGPNELFRNALRMAQCIEYGGPLPQKHIVPTMIACRRRPERTACRGTMMVLKTERDELYVMCPVCKSEEFLITNWQGTPWAEGPPHPIPIETDPFAAIDDDDEGAEETQTSLIAADGTLDIEVLRARIAIADSPNAVIEQVLAAARPANQSAAEDLVSAVVSLWNSTPRPELGGRSPADVYEADRRPATSDKVGRNQPCPCGSGLKYKRCCGAH